MDKQREFEIIKDACQSDGGKLILDDIRVNKMASDTILVMPIIDPVTKSILSPANDEMLKRVGYVQALNWVIGIIEHYQTAEYEEFDNEI